jgi:hypothetical protein
MWTKFGIAVTLVSLCFPVWANAQGFRQGDKEFLLTGSGSSDKKFDNNVFSFSGNLGYFFTDGLEAAFRQNVDYSNLVHTGNSWAFTSRLAADYNFNFGSLVPYIGASIGYSYGDNVKDTWVAGPEGGLKVFVNDTTFVVGSIAYDFFFTKANEADSAFNDGRWVYALGVGFRW